MESNNKILGNQLVVMSRDDLDSLVNEIAHNIVAIQAKNMQKDSWVGMDAPERKRFITCKETARLLHVNYSTLWRWNRQGYLRSRKVGWGFICLMKDCETIISLHTLHKISIFLWSINVMGCLPL